MAGKKASAPIIVMAPREVQINKFYGDGGARDTRRFEEEVKAAWRVQHCDTDQERRSLLWSHLGEEVRPELNCLLDGDTSDPQRLLRAIRKSYGERRSVASLLGVLQATRQRQGESSRAFSHRLREAFDTLQARQRETDATIDSSCLLRDYFSESLQDSILRRQLRERIATDPEVTFLELREQAIRWEDDRGVDHRDATSHQVKSHHPTEQSPGQLETLAAIQNLTEQVAKLTNLVAQSQPVVNPKPPITCFRCGGSGHIARVCPDRKQAAGNGGQLQK